MPKEVVTLSFGSYASFVSAHYWNLQDEAAGYSGREGWSEYAAGLDHGAMFEEVEGRNGAAAYRPRALFFDIAGSSGGVSFSADGGALPPAAASSSSSVPTWRGGCEVHRAAPVPRSPFLERLGEHEELDWESLGDEEAARQQAALEAAARQLDPGGGGGGGGGLARHWTDFCKVIFSPRSVYCLPGSWTSPYEHSLAAGWGAAADLLGSGSGGFAGGGGGGGGSLLVEEAADRVRHLGEACDSLAGFQVLADDLTGFGALAAAVLGEVVQEYSGRPLVLFSLRRPGPWEQQQGGGLAGGPVSTAWATARARDDLSQALALSRAAELASLYVPLAAPRTPAAALPYLSYDAALPFHSAAVLAAAVDSALLPTRLSGSRSPLGEPLGATDLHSLVRLLRPNGGGGSGTANLAALHLALPCPSLPADVRQLQQQLDERVRPPHASAAVTAAAAAAGAPLPAAGGPRGQALYGSTAQLSLSDGLASLTPGISGREGERAEVGGRGASRAESYCLRGARTDAGPATASAALEALDLLLRRQPHRMCVRHRCTAPMPLAVPLPFPHIFRSSVTQHGDVLTAAGGGGGGASAGGARPRSSGEGVHSVPVLTRLQATREFEGWVVRTRGAWDRAAAGAGGRAVLDGWGFGRDDVEEVSAQLGELAGSFEEEDEV